jgi:hypothetical protein
VVGSFQRGDEEREEEKKSESIGDIGLGRDLKVRR